MMTAAVLVVIVTSLALTLKMRKEEEVVGGGERDAGRLSLMTLLRLNSEKEERCVVHLFDILTGLVVYTLLYSDLSLITATQREPKASRGTRLVKIQTFS